MTCQALPATSSSRKRSRSVLGYDRIFSSLLPPLSLVSLLLSPFTIIKVLGPDPEYWTSVFFPLLFISRTMLYWFLCENERSRAKLLH